MKRKYYIDNLRSLVILLLFPFHTLRMYTSLKPFYVQGSCLLLSDVFVTMTSAWFMQLLFVLAGMSAYYSIQKRSIGQFVKERFSRLLLPCISGVILTVPIQTYFAEKQKNGYTGSFFHQYVMFFTKNGDLSGYSGGFTPGHLWFLLFLFLISMICIPVIIKVKKSGRPNILLSEEHLLLKLILLFIPFSIFGVVELGEPIGRYLFCFLLGFLLLGRDDILSYLKKKSTLLACLALLSLCCYTWLQLYTFYHGITATAATVLCYLLLYLTTLLMVFALLALGQRFFDFHNTYTEHFSKDSFSIYFVHQTILVAIGYYCLSFIGNIFLQIVLTMCLSFLMSLLCVAILKRIPPLRFLFGMPKK